MKQKTDLKKISVAAILSAAAYLCVFVFRFKVSFLTFDFKDAVLAVTAFLYGPLYGIASSLTVSLLEFITVSDTGVYGLIMNFLSSAVFSAVCGLFYKYRHSISGAILGAVFAVASMTTVMLAANILITPFYMGVERGEVIKMLPALLLPFNLIKGVINAAVTMLIYKPLTMIFKKSGLVTAAAVTNRKKFTALSFAAILVIIISVFLLIFCLKGSFSLFK